jgi:hypothetical protein
LRFKVSTSGAVVLIIILIIIALITSSEVMWGIVMINLIIFVVSQLISEYKVYSLSDRITKSEFRLIPDEEEDRVSLTSQQKIIIDKIIEQECS